MKKTNSLPLKGLALPFLFLLAFSCNRSTNDMEKKKDKTLAKTAPVSGSAAAPDAAPAFADQTAKEASADTVAAATALPGIPGLLTPQGLLLVKEASMDVSVRDIGSAARNIRQWLESEGGYYADWTQEQVGDQLSVDLTAKIPAEHFEAFKDSAEALGVLESERASATDMTDTFVTTMGQRALAQRIAGRYDHAGDKARRSRDELDAIDKSAEQETAGEAAAQDLARARRQIAMSTIHLKVSQPHPLPPPAEKPFGQRLSDNLGLGWAVVENFLLFLALLWPWPLLIGAVIFLVRALRPKAVPKP